MFGKKEEARKTSDSTVNTLLGEGSIFEGNLNLSATTRIDGTVKGNIKSDSMLIIGETGNIEGDIVCSEILIYGKVQGNVTCERLELKKGAVLNGDIKTRVLVIEEGAVYNGKCSMTQQEASPPKE